MKLSIIFVLIVAISCVQGIPEVKREIYYSCPFTAYVGKWDAGCTQFDDMEFLFSEDDSCFLVGGIARKFENNEYRIATKESESYMIVTEIHDYPSPFKSMHFQNISSDYYYYGFIHLEDDHYAFQVLGDNCNKRHVAVYEGDIGSDGLPGYQSPVVPARYVYETYIDKDSSKLATRLFIVVDKYAHIANAVKVT